MDFRSGTSSELGPRFARMVRRGNLDHPIILRGWFLNGIDFPIRIPVSETEIKTTSSGETLKKQRVLHFTKENISDLKAKVNGESGLSDLKVSSLQAVSAHMWHQ